MRANKVDRTCQHCGQEFKAHPCEVKKGAAKFCSRKCGRQGQPTIPLADRLRAKLSQPTEKGCLLWLGSCNDKGYGQINQNNPKKPVHTHRLAWELANGPIPDGLCVLHKCDIPNCCNPEHLFIGTKAENSADMAKKERAWKTKLTADQVKDIRSRQISGKAARVKIAREFQINEWTVRNILDRRSWKHVA